MHQPTGASRPFVGIPTFVVDFLVDSVCIYTWCNSIPKVQEVSNDSQIETRQPYAQFYFLQVGAQFNDKPNLMAEHNNS